VVTKIGRLDDRDVQDIEACIKRFQILKSQIENRATSIRYVGNEDIYKSNLKYILEKFFEEAQLGH
jgi:hypothetical protein